MVTTIGKTNRNHREIVGKTLGNNSEILGTQ